MTIDRKALLTVATRILNDLGRLSDEDLALVFKKRAKIRLLVEKASDKMPSETQQTPEALARLAADIKQSPSREAADILVTDLSKADLTALARQCDIPLSRRESAERLREKIVEQMIGHKLRSEAILGEDKK
jgi:hypothetical protein